MRAGINNGTRQFTTVPYPKQDHGFVFKAVLKKRIEGVKA